MLRSRYSGPASADSLWPLFALASADADRISALTHTVLGCPIDPSGSLEIHVIDERVLLMVRDGIGAIERQTYVEAWGDDDSEAHWWPFNWLAETPSAENLAEAIARAKSALTSFHFYDEEPVHASNGAEAAAVDYLRLASGVTGEWIISMAAQHELILNDLPPCYHEEVLLCFEKLPPGLAARGECALIGQAQGDTPQWWMRPVMCVFDNELDAMTIGGLRDRLVTLGFTSEEIGQLDLTADEVREAYARETTAQLSGSFSPRAA